MVSNYSTSTTTTSLPSYSIVISDSKIIEQNNGQDMGNPITSPKAVTSITKLFADQDQGNTRPNLDYDELQVDEIKSEICCKSQVCQANVNLTTHSKPVSLANPIPTHIENSRKPGLTISPISPSTMFSGFESYPNASGSMNSKENGDKGFSAYQGLCETPQHIHGGSYLNRSTNSQNKNNNRSDPNTLDTMSEAGKRKRGTRRGTLNAEAKNVLKRWMFSQEHISHPYPTEEEKEDLAAEAGIEVKQLSNWFTNARKRLWQPVLRQSGLEVKNFLSTGRGGPRGAKLEVPCNINLLLGKETSPKASKPVEISVAKRALQMSIKNKRQRLNTGGYSNLKCSDLDSDDGAPSWEQTSVLSPENNPDARKGATVHGGFLEQEIRAAESLLGLHVQCQPVH